MAEKAEEEVRDDAWVGGQGGHSLFPGGLLTTAGGCTGPTFSKALKMLQGFYLASLILGTYSREIARQKRRAVRTDRHGHAIYLSDKKPPSRKTIKSMEQPHNGNLY